MLSTLLCNSWWFGPAAALFSVWSTYWLAALSSSYYANQKFASFDKLEETLGPLGKDAVNRKWFSLRAAWNSLVYGMVVLVARWMLLSEGKMPNAYLGVGGGILLFLVVANVSHAKALWSWRTLVVSGSVSGQASYPQWFPRRRWGIDLVGSGVVLFVCFLFAQQWSLFGAGVVCLLTGISQLSKAQRTSRLGRAG